jgi:phage-related tail protein
MEPQTKVCPLCTGPLPISRFGLCRARSDGRNLYCMSCIRQKVSNQRKDLKEYKAAQKRAEEQRRALGLQTESIKSYRKLTPVEKVKEAIQNGARTQAQIRAETRLHIDVIGDALANLLLWSNEIKTQVVEGRRVYVVNTIREQPQVQQSTVQFFDIARKLGAPVVKGEKSIRRVA